MTTTHIAGVKDLMGTIAKLRRNARPATNAAYIRHTPIAVAGTGAYPRPSTHAALVKNVAAVRNTVAPMYTAEAIAATDAANIQDLSAVEDAVAAAIYTIAVIGFLPENVGICA